MRWILAVVVALTVCGSRAADAAPSAEEKFLKTIGKVALPYGSINQGKSKGLCACRTNGRIGALEVLVAIDGAHGICTLPDFDDAGDLIGSVGCNDWVPFVK